MNKKRYYHAAWISGFFMGVVLLLSACSEDQKEITNKTSSQVEATAASTNHQPLDSNPPFNQLVLNKISIDYPYKPSNSFNAFIKKLRARIDNKNMRAMQGELSSRFICQSPLCKQGLPIAQQFENIMANLEGDGWKSLLKMIDTKHYQQVNGHICGPAGANFTGDGREQVVGKGWGYVNGKDVRLRKNPSTRSAIVTHLTQDAVRLVSAEKIKKQGLNWMEVETLQGKKGFIADKFFLMLTPPQICYQQGIDQWKISGFRSPQ